jgi:hypothetical protein
LIYVASDGCVSVVGFIYVASDRCVGVAGLIEID